MWDWRSGTAQEREYLRLADEFIRRVDTLENSGVSYTPPAKRYIPLPSERPKKLQSPSLLPEWLGERLKIRTYPTSKDVTHIAAERMKEGMRSSLAPIMIVGAISNLLLVLSASSGVGLLSFGLPMLGFCALTGGVGAYSYLRLQQVSQTVDVIRAHYNSSGRDRFDAEITTRLKALRPRAQPQEAAVQPSAFPAASFCALAPRLLEARREGIEQQKLTEPQALDRARTLISFEAQLDWYVKAFIVGSGAVGLVSLFNPLVMALPGLGLSAVSFKLMREGVRQGRVVRFAAHHYAQLGPQKFEQLITQAQKLRREQPVANPLSWLKRREP